MIDDLKTNLRAAIKKIVNSSGIDDKLIDGLAHDTQMALLLADVDPGLVSEITTKLKTRAHDETPPPGLSRKDHIVKILYDELAKLLGGETEFQFHAGRTDRILMLGIQGSGKTTITSKLARLFTKQGLKVGVIGADTHRPGALVQLDTMCAKSGVEVFGDKNDKDSLQIIRKGLHHFEDSTPDVVLIDTAGRHKEEGDLLEEMRQVGQEVKPDLTLLVIDGTIGNQCFKQAKAFHETIPVGGIVVTKLDSSARGGGAIAASAATGAQVMYVGTGERIDDIEQFSPTRFVGRLLGMGDIKAILDLAKRLEDEGDEVRLKRISGGKMNMDDFYYQLEEVSKMGSLRGFLDNLPGFSGAIKEDQLDQMEDKMQRWRYIIQSMTKAEKDDPGLINSSRTTRIARGSGWQEHDVKQLLKNYKNSKNVMKASKGRQMQGSLKRMGLG